MRAERDQRMGSAQCEPTRLTDKPEGQTTLPSAGKFDAHTHERAFSEALAPEDASDQDEAVPMPTPFDLFGESKPVSGSTAEVATPQSLSLIELIVDTVQRLYVSRDGTDKRRISMDLADDVLPDVTLSVYEEDGRVVVDFECADERSHQALCDIFENLASEFANQIGRASRVYVRTDDSSAAHIRQADGDPILDARGENHDL